MKSEEARTELEHIGGIGETVANAIAEFFAEKHNQDALNHLLPELDVASPYLERILVKA